MHHRRYRSPIPTTCSSRCASRNSCRRPTSSSSSSNPAGDLETLKIEYYPRAGLFKDGRSRPNKEVRKREDDIEDKMNKSSMVTLWIDPKTHQILQYVFDDIDWDFFPGRSLVRIGDVQATMRMGQAFPNVWLPASIDMQFEMMLAVGAVDASYRVEYTNYKEAAVTYKIK